VIVSDELTRRLRRLRRLSVGIDLARVALLLPMAYAFAVRSEASYAVGTAAALLIAPLMLVCLRVRTALDGAQWDVQHRALKDRLARGRDTR
jgi:hypothetical protein